MEIILSRCLLDLSGSGKLLHLGTVSAHLVTIDVTLMYDIILTIMTSFSELKHWHLVVFDSVKTHMEGCNVLIDHRNIDIIGSTTRGEKSLLTLEALHQRTLNPSINPKDEYKRTCSRLFSAGR